MTYLGYHNDAALPIKQGQEIIIPAGVTVRSCGSRGAYVTKRAQKVKVRMLMPGQSVPARLALNDRDYYNTLDARGYDFAIIKALRDTNDMEYYSLMVPISNPSVTWAGAGGYWCDVDINDILSANGLTEKPVAA